MGSQWFPVPNSDDDLRQMMSLRDSPAASAGAIAGAIAGAGLTNAYRTVGQ